MRDYTFGVLTALLLILTACGDDTDSDAPGSGGSGASDGSGGSAAAPSGGSGGSAAENSGGTGGSTPASGGSAGAGGSGGSASGCEGEFGPVETLLALPGFYIGSPTLTADELELFYIEEPQDQVYQSTLKVLRRASREESFGAPTTVPELSVCPPYEGQSADVSGDGLRMYFTCHLTGYPSASLYRAVRSDRSSAFVVEPDPIGEVGLSVDISTDELTLLSSADSTDPRLRIYTRTSLTEPFGAGQAVEGIDAALITPELSSDGLLLLGTLPEEAYRYSLVVARRSSTGEPFSGLTGQGLPTPPAGISYAAPALSTDCRSLYFVRVDESGNYTLHVARR